MLVSEINRGDLRSRVFEILLGARFRLKSEEFACSRDRKENKSVEHVRQCPRRFAWKLRGGLSARYTEQKLQSTLHKRKVGPRVLPLKFNRFTVGV